MLAQQENFPFTLYNDLRNVPPAQKDSTAERTRTMSMERTSGTDPLRRHGYPMMVVLCLSYIAFAMNWVAGSSLSREINLHFWGTAAISPVVSQAVNYSITFARVIANLLAAFVLTRLGSKKAPALAIFLMTSALIAIYLPNYWAYTIARMFMGLGGSMVIVYTNPVLSHYIQDPRTKLRISGANTAAYNIGAFIVSLLFTLFPQIMTWNWQVTLTITAVLTVILFVVWLCKAENFPIHKTASGDLLKYGYRDALRDPFLWKYALGFSGFLVIYVIPITSLKSVLDEYTTLTGSLVALLVASGALIGTVIGIRLGNTGMRRKPVLLVSGILMTVFMAGTVLLPSKFAVLAYLCALLSGAAQFSQYVVYMNIPHEMKGNSPQKLTTIFGLFWGISYAIFTVIQIIWSYLLGTAGYIPAMLFFLACTCQYVIFAVFLPETKPRSSASV